MSEKRPVKLLAKQYKIRNDAGVLYTTHTPIDCNDLNAPECAFERAQVEAKVLIIVSEGNEADQAAAEEAAIAAAEAAAAEEAERLKAEAAAEAEAAEAAAAAAAAEAEAAAAAEAATKPAKKA
jgi:hypothetical protein